MSAPTSTVHARPVLAVTIGDAAGIGPEVLVRAMENLRREDLCLPLVIGHPQVIRDAAVLAGVDASVALIDRPPESRAALREQLDSIASSGCVACLNPVGDDVLSAPRCSVSALAGDAAFQYLTAAIELARAGLVDAIVTAPLNKEALHLAGHCYPGHTEILAEQCGVNEFAMMLHLPESAINAWRPRVRLSASEGIGCGHGLSIAHVTLHTSVASVPGRLSRDAIIDTITLMHGFLRRIGCTRSAIAVAALNPHGGEHGLFGDEEQRVIEPAVSHCQQIIRNLHGPLPIDTLMRRAVAGEFDGLIVMYHDQGHIPIKLIGFERAVNITLGLPIIRTSPTHGTAFDRAWNPATPADSHGMEEAIRTAVALVQTRA